MLSFGASINNQYSLDDEFVTTPKNKIVSKGVNGIKEIITSPYSITEGGDSFGYRPVTIVSFALEYQLFGFNTKVSHILNLLLYTCIVLLLYKILGVLFPTTSVWILFLICSIFALHPLHSEVVLSLKNREELFVAMFGFLAFYSSIIFYSNRKKKFLFFSVILCILGLFTKLTFYPFVIFIPLSLWYLKVTSIKQSTLLFGYFLMASLISIIPYLLIDESLSRSTEFFENPLFSMTLLEQLPNGFSSLFIYLKLHVFPYPLLSYYGYPHIEIFDWADYQVYLGIFFLAVIVYGIYLSKNKLLGLGLITYLIFTLPFINFPIPAVGIIAERFTFSSVLGFAIVFVSFVVFAVNALTKSKLNMPYYASAVGVIALVFLFINRERTSQWETSLSLVRIDVTNAPKSTKLQMLHGDLAQLAMARSKNLKERAQYTNEAIGAYSNAIRLYPEYPGTYNNLGVIYSVSGEHKKAIPFIEKAISLGDSTAVSYYNLGACYELLNEKVKAKEYYLKSLIKDKEYQLALDRLLVLNGPLGK